MPEICRLAGRGFSRGGWLLAMCFTVVPGWTARAADLETRDFRVFVDNKPAGEVHMTIHRKDDGITEVACDTDIVVKILIKKYVYSYRGREAWKDGRLVGFASATHDDGKRFKVTAEAKEDGLHVTVNGRERVIPADCWMTSYWSLPGAKRRDQAIPLLDADNGHELECRINKIGEEQVQVAGEAQNATHYRLTGKLPNIPDLWYDSSDRLVREEFIEEGHRTVLELVRIRR